MTGKSTRFCDHVETFRQRAADTPVCEEKTKLEELCRCLEDVGCDPGRADRLVPELVELEQKLDSCEAQMTPQVCQEYRAKLNEVVGACSAGA